jgi:hypothetical protein
MVTTLQDGQLYGYNFFNQDKPFVPIKSLQDALTTNNKDFAVVVKNV